MPKEFSWSWSKIDAYDTCPKRLYEVQVAKNFVDSTEQLDWGNTVHKAMADACAGKTPLPDSMKDWQHWVDEMQAGPGELVVEQKYALTRDFQPTEYFGPRAWYRGICDIARISGPVALARDWKTGKLKMNSQQLMLMAQCLFAFFPQLKRIKTEFVWLKEDCTTGETYDRATIHNEWIGMLPRVAQLENAFKTMTFEPKPGRLCAKYCPVMSCPYHGKYHH